MLSALLLVALVVADGPASSSAESAETPTASETAVAPTPPRKPLMLVLRVAGDRDPALQELSEALSLGLLERVDLDVQSQDGLQQKVDLASEQQTAGCDSDGCLAEIASAAGARFIVFSRLAKVGGQRVLRVEIFDDSSARTLSVAVVKGADGAALVAALPDALDGLLDEAGGALPRRAVEHSVIVDERSSFDVAKVVGGGVTVGVSAAAVIVGGLFVAGDSGRHESLRDAGEAYRQSPIESNAQALVAARTDLDDKAYSAPLGQVLIAAGLLGGVVGSVFVVVGLLEQP